MRREGTFTAVTPGIAGMLLAVMVARPEVIDRIAVTVDRTMITESDIVRQIRVAAFLNGERADLSAGGRRKAAEQLIELAFIGREMAMSRYPEPSPQDVEAQLAKLRAERDAGAGWQSRLEAHGLSEGDMKKSVGLQLMTLRFVAFRFRPGVGVSDEEVEQHYRRKFLPEWKKNGSPPALEDVWDEILEALNEQKVDEALNRWLVETRAQSRVEFREEAFR